jgi:hypothetical protein
MIKKTGTPTVANRFIKLSHVRFLAATANFRVSRCVVKVAEARPTVGEWRAFSALECYPVGPHQTTIEPRTSRGDT